MVLVYGRLEMMVEVINLQGKPIFVVKNEIQYFCTASTMDYCVIYMSGGTMIQTGLSYNVVKQRYLAED